MDMNNEPVAWIKQGRLGCPVLEFDKPFRYKSYAIQNQPIPLYTHPAKTLTLTPDEIFDIWDEHTDYDGNFISDIDTFVLAILRKAQEK